LRIPESVIITKHGQPVAQPAPVRASPHSLFGYMMNTVRIGGGLVSPLGVDCSALSGDEDHLYK
jgi:antitoxin (DNA-binding transcriptional repressor) of toxin-antitoxin stability system